MASHPSSSHPIPPDSDPPSSSSVDPPEIKYDVFVSFRGKDTRSGFLSHLLDALDKEKIHCFYDEKNIEEGDEISPTLLGAIEKSKISLVLFSEDYASSTWCLQELEQIIQCMQNQKQILLPVFYKVDPSTVRHQKRKYCEAFDKHGERFDDDRLQKWKAALRKASDLSGFDSSKYNTDAILVKAIVERVLEKPRETGNEIDLEGFVGMQNHIEDLEKLLHTESQDIFIIGIWGMGGVGKTTIAEILYNKLQLHNKYDGKYFLRVKEQLERHRDDIEQLRRYLLSKLLSEKEENFDDVTLHSIPTWVKRRLNRKKILVVLDDINKSDQLEILTGGHKWFGSGSRIIMTSRDQHLFSSKCDKIHKVKQLNPEDAAQLFEKTLTEKCHVRKQERCELSEKVLNYVQGIPLAINVLARFLWNKNKDEWKSKLEKLEKMPDMDIQVVLELSYHGLKDEEHKAIFLYLACFFRIESKERIISLLDNRDCGYYAIDGLRALQDKALITISEEGFVYMHDLIRVMGREIVRKTPPRQRSHVWDVADISDVFENEKGTRPIESIRLEIQKLENGVQLGPQAFARMKKLRLLQVDYMDVYKYGLYPPEEGFESFPKALRCLIWNYFPSRSLMSRFCNEYLVELRLRDSRLQRLWSGCQDLPNLEVIDLSWSIKLIEVPDLSKAPKLRSVELDDCHKLRYFGLWPNHNVFPSLQFLSLCACHCFDELPGNIDLCLPSLQKLILSNTDVKTIPASIKHLSHLKELIVCSSWPLRYIPELPPSIEFIVADQCRSLETIQFASNSMPLSHKHRLILELECCDKLDDHALRSIARYFKFTIQSMISASIKDGYAYLRFSRSKIPELFADIDYRVTQDSRSLALVLPLHSEVMGFIFFAVCDGFCDTDGIKCHIAFSSDIELRNNAPDLKDTYSSHIVVNIRE